MSNRQMQELARREFLWSLAGSAAAVSLAHVSRFAEAEDNKGGSEAGRPASWSLVLHGKPSPVLEKAAQYLHDTTGSAADYPATGRRDAEVVVRVDGRFEAEAGREGFVIQSTSSLRIDVGGATADGAANGLFAMARRLKRETERDPFALQWDTSDAPRFEERGILFLHFLTQYTHLTVDGFIVADWRAYIDFLRSLEANTVGVLSMKYYSPAVPETDRYRPFYENMREAVRYAHQMGRYASNVLYLTDPEGGMETQLSVFPFPRITETKKEIDRSRRVDVDGIDGWRLAPVVRFISDNLVLRWAWNPDVDAKRTVQDIVEESVSQAEQRTALGKAIWTLEEFGQTMNLEALRRTDELFTEVCRLEAPQAIRHTAEGVRVLLAVAELAFETERRPTMEDAKAIFELMAESEIYQGYTTDQAWIVRSCTIILLPMLTEWVNHLRQLAGTKPRALLGKL